MMKFLSNRLVKLTLTAGQSLVKPKWLKWNETNGNAAPPPPIYSTGRPPYQCPKDAGKQ